MRRRTLPVLACVLAACQFGAAASQSLPEDFRSSFVVSGTKSCVIAEIRRLDGPLTERALQAGLQTCSCAMNSVAASLLPEEVEQYSRTGTAPESMEQKIGAATRTCLDRFMRGDAASPPAAR